MNINITLFAQIIHFYLVYLFLDRFFFGPFVRYITDQENGYKLVVEKLQAKDKLLTTLQDNKMQQLIQFQNHIKEHYKQPTSQPQETATLTLLSITPDKVNQAKEHIESFIVERICHAR